MWLMLHCPSCNGPMGLVGSCQITHPILKLNHEDLVIACTCCPAVTEIERSTRSLLDFHGLTVSSLYSPHPFVEMTLSARSLRPGSMLRRGES